MSNIEYDPFDLTILYTEDTIQWCEYLFDVFKDFDIKQNAEDITEFPTNPSTLRNIQESLVTVVIVSPRFLQKCTPKLQDYVGDVVGLICGVDDADMSELVQKIPTVADWTLVEAAAGGPELSRVVLKMLHETSDKLAHQRSDTEDTYLTIPGEGEFIQSDYMEMVGRTGSDDDCPESTYYKPDSLGLGGTAQAPTGPGVQEEFYETMVGTRPPVAPSGAGHVPTGPGDQEEFYETMVGTRPPMAPGGAGHIFQETSKEYVNMNKGKLSPQCSPGLSIYPQQSGSGDGSELYIFFQEPVVNVKDQYLIRFQGQLKQSEVVANFKNPYTLLVELPLDHPAELVDVQVTVPNQSMVGTFKFLFTGICNELADMLLKAVDPVNFMCESLGISPGDANELDNKLYEHIQHCVPSSGLGLLVNQTGREQGVPTEVPTALHFAAKFGLKNICSMLVNSPGAVHAMRLKNSQGHTPDILADKHGHNDLKCFLETFLEIATDESSGPAGGGPSSYVFMKTQKMYYNQNQLLKQLQAEQISDYDFPFHVPIPAVGVPLTREETIKKLVQGKQEDIEEYYGSLTLDMGSFERDDDAEQEYDLVQEHFGPPRLVSKKLSADRPPAKQPVGGDNKPALPPLSPLPLPPGSPPSLPPISPPVLPSESPPVPPPESLPTPAVEPRVPKPESETPENILPKKNVQARDILNLPPLAAGQQHLIEIQNRVKNSEVSVDEAVLLFRNWEHLQETNRLSFSTQAETFKALKQQKQKGGFGGLFSRKPGRKGLLSRPARRAQVQSDPIIYRSHVQQQPLALHKTQERILQTEVSQQNRPTSTTSLDSHGSRDSSYNSAPDEPDQERYHHASHLISSVTPVTRRQDSSPGQQDRINRLSQVYDQLPLFSQKPTPPMPSRSTKPLPSSIKNLPKPSPPYGPGQADEIQATYPEFEEQTPEDLPDLPPPPPPVEPQRSQDVMSTIQIPRYPDNTAPRSPATAPRQPPPNKRPIPRPRNPPK